MKIFFLLLIFSFNFSVSSNERKYSLPLEENITATIDRLLDQGITSINALDINKLKEQMATIKVIPTTSELPQQIYDRNSAFYQDGFVFSQLYYPGESQDSLRLLATHEALGALGYDDKDYQKTILLELMSTTNPYNLKEKLEDFNVFEIMFEQDQLHSDGGVTGIGGGGDLSTMLFKYDIFKMVSIFAHHIKVEQLLLLLKLQFEPNNKEPEETLIKLRTNANDSLLTLTGSNTDFYTINPIILVPPHYNKMDNRLRNQTMMDALNFLFTYSRTLLKSEYEKGYLKVINSCDDKSLLVHREILENDVVIRSGGIGTFIKESFCQ